MQFGWKLGDQRQLQVTTGSTASWGKCPAKQPTTENMPRGAAVSCVSSCVAEPMPSPMMVVRFTYEEAALLVPPCLKPGIRYQVGSQLSPNSVD